MNESLTISVHEAAEQLGISDRYVYNLSHTRGFPTVRIGRRIRISREGLKAWVENQTSNQEVLS